MRFSFDRSIAVASREGWAVVAATRPDGTPSVMPRLGTVDLQYGLFHWKAQGGHFRPGWHGYRLHFDGPHELRWGTAGPIVIYGAVDFSIETNVAVRAPALRLAPDGVGAGLHWSPATLPGTLVLSGAAPALDQFWRNTRLAPAQAAAALITLLAGAEGQSATIPLSHKGSWLEAAGFPVLPWP